MAGKLRKAPGFTVLIFAAVQAFGQSVSNPDSALRSILDGISGTPLSLKIAEERGVENATGYRRAEASYLAAAGSVRHEAGLFDPSVFFNLNYVDQKQPTASFFLGAPVLSTQTTTSQAGIRMDLPIGTELELALNTVKLGTNSEFAFLNPEYDAFGSLSFRQPLLGGFAASARKRLTQAEQGMEAEKARFDQQFLATRTAVEHAYWELYAAERDYAVQVLTQDRALAFLKETEVRAGTGLVGPDQVANARTFLAQQQLLLIDREEALDHQSDALASLIGVRPDPGSERFRVVDEPPADFPADSVDVLVQQALKTNLDLIAAGKDVAAAHTLAQAAGWEALPSVNLVGSLGGNGLSGTAQDVIFLGDTLRTTRTGSFADALNQVGRRDFPAWSIGVEVNIPIGFRSGLGEKDVLEAQVLNAEQVYVEKARALEAQIRSSYRELVHGKRRLEVARQGVDAAQEQVRIGMIEFRNGRSTAFELVRLGEDLAVAEQRYSEALVRTADAAATLRQLTSGAYPTHGQGQ